MSLTVLFRVRQVWSRGIPSRLEESAVNSRRRYWCVVDLVVGVAESFRSVLESIESHLAVQTIRVEHCPSDFSLEENKSTHVRNGVSDREW
jgi:hypothetical protein